MPGQRFCKEGKSLPLISFSALKSGHTHDVIGTPNNSGCWRSVFDSEEKSSRAETAHPKGPGEDGVSHATLN